MTTRSERLLLLYSDLASARMQRQTRLLLEREILDLEGMSAYLTKSEWQQIALCASEVTQGWQQRIQPFQPFCPEFEAELRRFLFAWLRLLHAATTQTQRFNNGEEMHLLRRREVLQPCLAAIWACTNLPPEADPGRSWVVEELLRMAMTVAVPCQQAPRRQDAASGPDW